MKTINEYKQELQEMKDKADMLKYRIQYYKELLTTTFKKEVKISLGYTLLQFCTIIFSLLMFFALFKSYADYRIETEKIIREKTIECQIYERYFDMEDNKIDTLRIYNY